MKFECQQFVSAVCVVVLTTPAFAASNFVTDITVTQSADVVEIAVELACSVEYVGHSPGNNGNRLRIQVDVTSICSGASPSVASTRELHRPTNADVAKLIEVDYNGAGGANSELAFSFSEDVRFSVVQSGLSNTVIIHVVPSIDNVVAEVSPRTVSARVQRENAPAPMYVINLSSSQRPHAASERPDAGRFPDLTIFESEVMLGGGKWYRLRLGYFGSPVEAVKTLTSVQEQFPTAWIDRIDSSLVSTASTDAISKERVVPALPVGALASIGLDEIDELMTNGQRVMVAGDLSQAIQIYTKVLRVPGHDRLAEAQEFLALAREKNGQKAHAKAEYQRYLALYSDADGASRVRQRLASLLASDRRSGESKSTAQSMARTNRSTPGDWRFQTYFSQYYRRDANQLNEEAEVVSQSALYSDVNLDVRRRGQRFDFSSRLSAGYRNDFLENTVGSGNELRVSYAYADLADSETGLRGRIGRQSRNSGGVLGRFDGLNLSYQASERISINTVAGLPVNSASDSTDSERVFYGASANYGPILDNLELGIFFVQQNIEGIEDRQAIGTEFRYFGDNQNLWGLVDYDTSYNELSSAFLQGSWRFGSRLSVHGSLDRRHSPYLSTGAAMIGQPVTSFSELQILLTEEEIRELSLDRAPLSTSYTIGLSHTLSPRLQINMDANQTTVDATRNSGGVAATPESSYQYYSTSLIASSLFKEGDVSMIGVRQSKSDNSSVWSLTMDSRYPIGRQWRINPRIRIDQREITTDGTDELTYTPGIRVQYRRSQKFRMELEAGRQYSERETRTIDLDRKSYFVNLGYQAFF